MDAFVDFHYVSYGGRVKNYFVNEMHIILFDTKTAAIIKSTNATFNNPSLHLSPRYEHTFRYGYENCHGMSLCDGANPHTALRDFVKELETCTNIFVRGSVKRRVLSRLIKGASVYNITMLISETLGCGAAQTQYMGTSNLPGYVTYAYIRSAYKSDECCDVHKTIKNGDIMCISNQCTSTFLWFVNNYYWLVKNNIDSINVC